MTASVETAVAVTGCKSVHRNRRQGRFGVKSSFRTDSPFPEGSSITTFSFLVHREPATGFSTLARKASLTAASR